VCAHHLSLDQFVQYCLSEPFQKAMSYLRKPNLNHVTRVEQNQMKLEHSRWKTWEFVPLYLVNVSCLELNDLSFSLAEKEESVFTAVGKGNRVYEIGWMGPQGSCR
jgi:hypothetical protein